MTDNIVHLPEYFLKLISDFYNSCITHGFLPDKILMHTIVPIHNGSKSVHKTDNYRAIVLCVLLLKIFEYCLLISNKDKVLVGNLQFAYKAEHSTSQCTWLAKQVITYYTNNGSNVSACLLHCSKTFDKIKLDLLCKKLNDKGLSPLTVRIKMNMYLYQNT